MWPNSHRGSLDGTLLHQLGTFQDRIIEEADNQPPMLFFHQLMLPTHNIDNNKVITWTQIQSNITNGAFALKWLCGYEWSAQWKQRRLLETL